MTSSLLELHYLPCADYFAAIFQHDELIIERHENYMKQSYRNRCYLQTANGVASLTVPVVHNAGKTPITDLRIDYSQKWLNIHWRTIQSAYGKAPFFEHYADDLHAIFLKKPAFLYDLNLSLLTLCLSWLRYSGAVKESHSFEKEVLPPIIDLRSAIHPKKSDDPLFLKSARSYTQVFGNKFVSNLSLIDVVFCLGPDARHYVQS
jgi:hypothetical protein